MWAIHWRHYVSTIPPCLLLFVQMCTFIFCLNATMSSLSGLIFFQCVVMNVHMLYRLHVYMFVFPSARKCSVPRAVVSSRPSDYCCLLHRQINPVNTNNPPPSLSTIYSLTDTHSSSFIHFSRNVLRSSAFLSR